MFQTGCSQIGSGVVREEQLLHSSLPCKSIQGNYPASFARITGAPWTWKKMLWNVLAKKLLVNQERRKAVLDLWKFYFFNLFINTDPSCWVYVESMYFTYLKSTIVQSVLILMCIYGIFLTWRNKIHPQMKSLPRFNRY